MIVPDTNLVSYLVIQGTHTSAARAVYARDPVWVLPPLWRSEFLSVLAVSIQAGVLTERQARTAWRTATGLVGTAEEEPDPMAVLGLAVAKGISAYDAQFVALAQMLDTMLVTGDRKLVARCPNRAISIDRFAAGGPR